MNGDGFISVDELQSNLKNKGYTNSPLENVPDVIKTISKDGNDVITLPEFENVLKKQRNIGDN